MITQQVLLVEDEPALGETLSEYLADIGLTCTWVKTSTQAKELFLQNRYTVALLDIGLPDGNGLELARWMRNEKKDLLFLFLSAQNDPQTRLEGLEIGAQDYITKPFALKELVLRLKRILEWQGQTQKSFPEQLTFGRLKVNLNNFEIVDADGNIQSIGQKECGILKLLLEKKNTPVERDEIIEIVWGADAFPSNRTVDNYIVKLRRWCESDTNQPLQIQSIRGIGYKLVIKN